MEIALILLGLIGGGAATFFIQRTAFKAQTAKVLKDAEIEAENIRKERALQAKETFLKQKEEHDTFIKDRERKLQSNEDRARSKEKNIDQKLEEFERKEQEIEKLKSTYESKFEILELRMQDADKTQQKRVEELSKISKLSAEEAKKMLMEALTDEARTGAMATIKKLRKKQN